MEQIIREGLPLSYEPSKYLVEIPKDPTDTGYWDMLLRQLGKIFPHHYYVDDDYRTKLKRAAKRRIFGRILKIAGHVLTQKQFEAFSLYYNFYPHKTIEDVSKILGISFWAASGRLISARFNVLRAVLERSSDPTTRQRIAGVLKGVRDLRNRASNKWRHRTGWKGRHYAFKRRLENEKKILRGAEIL